MAEKLELPDDLTPDMEVLFVNPYDPDESRMLHFSGATTRDLTALFHRAQARDPGFARFEDTVATVKTILGLKGYLVGDDLIILYGGRDELEKARDMLKDQYTCFFDKIADFLDHLENEDAVVTLKTPKPVLN